jgi:predicted DNA binding CopG/RHH family protein
MNGKVQSYSISRVLLIVAVVLHFMHMSHTLTIRLTEELLSWLKERSRQTGVPMGRLVREQLETAKANGGKQRFMRHIGALTGPPDLSSRKGYSKK